MPTGLCLRDGTIKVSVFICQTQIIATDSLHEVALFLLIMSQP